jgi:twitching motility two-component system response regulator PilG
MKVLIVEDAKTLSTLVQVYLMGWGIQFVVASDGAEGLAKARTEKPDLVISDVRMPRMDGFELCAALRADRDLARVPVVLLTSLNDEQSHQQGRIAGASAFLNKPISVNALREVVARLLGLPEVRK